MGFSVRVLQISGNGQRFRTRSNKLLQFSAFSTRCRMTRDERALQFAQLRRLKYLDY